MPPWLRAVRVRIAWLRALGIRVRTLTGGVALAGALLLALALVGGVHGVVSDRPADPDPTRSDVGPLTAVQPELREALLTEAELRERAEPGATPTAEPPGAILPADPDSVAVAPTVVPAGGQETGTDRDERCGSLLGDALTDVWQATPPRRTTTRHTSPRDGGALEQLIGVFDAGQAPEAYGRLRETAAACDRAVTTLDGDPVTVLLEELSSDREESGSDLGPGREESTSVDEGYAIRLVLEGKQRTLTGWLAVDRLGSVISVLRHLEPAEAAAQRQEADPDPGEIRLAALEKLRALLRAIDD